LIRATVAFKMRIEDEVTNGDKTASETETKEVKKPE
jgi:hypothetical protein